MNRDRLDRWFVPERTDPGARARLFLFPHSGGSAAAYAPWSGLLPAAVAGQAVQLPGRQDRAAEPPHRTLAPLIGALRTALEAELDDRPYGFFGHSMGALLAYRLALDLERDGAGGPVLVGASGWAPVGFAIPEYDPALPDAELARQVAELGAPATGGPAPGLLESLPAMRADFAVCVGHRDDGGRLRCPVVAYAGRDDPLLPPAAVSSWADRTPRFLGSRIFPGRHFFVSDHAPEITAEFSGLLLREAG